jgi:signal transduction histidine kinase
MNVDLRRVPLFSGLDDTQLRWLLENSEWVAAREGEVLMREGEPGEALFIIIEGEVEVTKRTGNSDVLLAVRGTNEIMGEMSLLENRPRTATVRVTRRSELLKISRKTFDELLSHNPAASLTMLRTVSSRLRNSESMLRQNEKMAALGTLSAGLAHELNNPAAAARRGASVLRQALVDHQRLTGQLYAQSLSNSQMDAVDSLRLQLANAVEVKEDIIAPSNALHISDMESDLQDWLESQQIEEAWDIAPTLVASNWNADRLKPLLRDFTGERLSCVIQWLAKSCLVYSLLDEIHHGTERVSEIVKAVKSYSYLDQAPVQELDVHRGLEDTLIILGHKLKQGVRIHREYATNLPRIEGYGSELNQVWTNIIDNAIDAMHGQGDLTIKTTLQTNPSGVADAIAVDISDTGPGMPAAVQEHIFEPFFTTKPVGVGTGLGLHITYSIIQKHRGKVDVSSRPGSTTFHIVLPTRLPAISPAAK